MNIDKSQGISKETEQFIEGAFDEDTCRKIWGERHPRIPYPKDESKV